MVYQIVSWQCDICKGVYTTEAAARACEAQGPPKTLPPGLVYFDPADRRHKLITGILEQSGHTATYTRVEARPLGPFGADRASVYIVPDSPITVPDELALAPANMARPDTADYAALAEWLKRPVHDNLAASLPSAPIPWGAAFLPGSSA